MRLHLYLNHLRFFGYSNRNQIRLTYELINSIFLDCLQCITNFIALIKQIKFMISWNLHSSGEIETISK